MARKVGRASALNLANLLTLLRLVLVPVFAVYLMEGRWAWSFAVFALAAATDYFDGWVARACGCVTPLGVFVDPLADKALQLTAFTVLAMRDVCPPWVAVLAWSREFLVVTGFTLLALVSHKSEVRVTRLGKLGTFFQMAALGLLLGVRAFVRNPSAEPLAVLALAAAVLLNFFAGLEYVLNGLKAQGDPAPPG